MTSSLKSILLPPELVPMMLATVAVSHTDTGAPRDWRADMPQPSGDELTAIRDRRDRLRDEYLQPLGQRPATTVRGVHHVALICKDVEQTIRFYQGMLGFPLVELVENRDYAGSSHFFFDIGNRNLLGFFDFPGHDHPDFMETIGGVQHLALSADAENFAAARKKLDAAGIEYLGPDRGVEDSLYIRDPNGIGIELYEEELGVFNGEQIL
jgi:glyoxylase I family protein